MRIPTRLSTRVSIAVLLGALTALGGVARAEGLDIRNAYSPRNAERPRRSATEYIVLHTTEGPGRGSLAKLRRDGETHYMVDEAGRVYRVIDKDRVAYHAGDSMWAGKRDIDRLSVAIEVAGYHDRRLRSAQLTALKELIRQLQAIYGIPDERVLTHSMIAYGRPNRYHRYAHRGRKRCGMVFAREEVREALGLVERPWFDPDVRAGRLRVADAELQDVLFPAPRREAAPRAAPTPSTPPAVARADTKPSDRARRDQPGDRVMLQADGRRSAAEWLGAAHDALTTIYLFPSGLVRTGRTLAATDAGRRLLQDLPAGTRVLLKHHFGGYVTAGRAPSQIAGHRWNHPETLYRLPDGRLVPGHEIDADRIPRSTLVFPPA